MKIIAIFTLIFGAFILGPFWFWRVETSNNYLKDKKAWHEELNSWIFTKPLYWSFWILFDKDESKLGW